MRFKQWLNLEMYSRPVMNLKRYLQNKPMDAYEHVWWIIRWLKDHPEIVEEYNVDLEKLEDMYHDDSEELPEILEKIVNQLSSEQRSEIADYIAAKDPSEAPTWTYMSFNQMVRPNTWLVHFADSATEIYFHGFTRGVDNLTKLGLTTQLPDYEKDFGGYNFAFRANSRDAYSAAREGKYGKEAVMFRASGLEATHYGDEENQVIFYGRSIDPGQIVLLTKEYDNWCVKMKDARDGRECAYVRENFSDVVNWVMNNFDQYRKRITDSKTKWSRPDWV